jgi:hypothetical protein
MMSDTQLETVQLVFSIEKEIVLMELREMLEKTANLERIIRQAIGENQVDEDTFRPCPGIICPPKKKMRRE